MFSWRIIENYPSIITKYPPYCFIVFVFYFAGSKKDSMNKSNESASFIAVYNSDINMLKLLLNSGKKHGN